MNSRPAPKRARFIAAAVLLVGLCATAALTLGPKHGAPPSQATAAALSNFAESGGTIPDAIAGADPSLPDAATALRLSPDARHAAVEAPSF